MLTKEQRSLIGEAFRNKRKELNLTQDQLIDIYSEVGLTEITYKRAERGAENVSIERLLDIANVLGVNLGNLFLRLLLQNQDKAGECLPLYKFLLYLPLIDPWYLYDSLLRITGKFDIKPHYTQQQIDWLYASIPESKAKLYADIQYLLLSQDVAPDSGQDHPMTWNEYYDLYIEYERVLRARRSCSDSHRLDESWKEKESRKKRPASALMPS